MIKAIENNSDGEVKILTHEAEYLAAELVGGELSADEVATVNAAYPGCISEGYQPKTFAAPPDEPEQYLQ